MVRESEGRLDNILIARSTETICQNLCIHSVHPSWIDKHRRQHTTALLVQLALASSCTRLMMFTLAKENTNFQD